LGSAAWAWETWNGSPYPGDLVNPPWTGGTDSLTQYGQEVAAFIAPYGKPVGGGGGGSTGGSTGGTGGATDPTLITPGNGSFTDWAGNVYTIDTAGNADENGAPIPNGSGTGAMEYANGIVYGQDIGTGNWYNWNQSTWTASAAPPAPTSGGGGGGTAPPPTTTRDPLQTPFSSDSIWNLPLGTGAQWQYNAQLAGAGVFVNTNGNYNEDIYASTDSDPLVTVTSDGSFGGGAGTWTLHIPSNAVPAGPWPAPTDNPITIDDTTTHTWYSFGGFAMTSPTTATAHAGSGESDFGDGLQDDQSNWDGGVGTLRGADLAAGSIDHMLRVEVSVSMLQSWDPNSVTNLAPYAWPQTREDGFANGGGVPTGMTPYTGTIPFGVTVGIPQGVAEPADVKANAGADMLWHALQDHGAMIRDSTGPDNPNFTFQTDQTVEQDNPLIQGMEQYGQEIMAATQILTNQGPNSINGGGTPVVALDPPLSDAGGDTNPPPPPPTNPAGVTTGKGSDSLVLAISEDAYQGDAEFTVSVDGTQLGGTFTSTASHAAGQEQSFTFKGDWAPGSHSVTVNFLNDAYSGTATTDRNLYVDKITCDGASVGQSLQLFSGGPQSFTVNDTTAIPVPSPDGTEITAASASPIIDKSGNAWSLVQSASSGLQIAVNGTVDPATQNVVLLETLGGNMVQENTNGNWYSETGPGAGWGQIANPTPPAPVTIGTGSDTLVLSVSEDPYANGDGTSDASGDAIFTVSVDGKQLAGTFFASALHSASASQNFTFKGDWGSGAHAVAVNFLNDAWDGTATTDRNLYVNDVTYDGTDTKQSGTLASTGTQSFSVTDSTALPLPVIGGGSDTLLLKVSEDAYKGDAQFTVSVDGEQLGGTFTATTLHSPGGSQSLAFKGDFGAGAHTVAVQFLNDAYAGTAATDRNLYVNDIVYNGTDTHLSGSLMGNGAKTFAVSGGTTPSVSETGDHGSLQKNLSQTGTYSVGGDTFVLTSGNASSVTLGTGASQVKFVGPNSVKLTGGSGQATVAADAGNNTFIAGAGSLDITGGAGKDAYVFHATGGLLTVEDFSLAKGDTLTVDKSLQASLHQATDGRGGMMLTFGTDASHGVDIRGMASMSSTNILWA
jgi:hypothetical protein